MPVREPQRAKPRVCLEQVNQQFSQWLQSRHTGEPARNG